MHAGMRRHDADNRAFNYAVLCSIVLHGLLLFGLTGLREPVKRPEVPPGPIVARLAQPRAAPVPPAPVPQSEPQPAPPVQESPPPPVPKPAPAAKPAPLARAEKTPSKAAPVAPSKAAPSAAAPEPVPAASSPPVAAPPSAPAKSDAQSAAAPSAPAMEADAGTVAQYRLQLIGVAKRYKRYPRVAMDNNWEGTAEIRMVIGANGMISSIVVKKGSGHDVLDQEAIQWIKKAKPLAPIPSALRGREFIVDIPVIFNLKDPGA